MRKIVNPQPAGFKNNAKGFDNQAHKTAAEKEAFTEGSKQARLISRAPQVLRLLQQAETILKSIAHSSEEENLLRDLSAMLDYIELGK